MAEKHEAEGTHAAGRRGRLGVGSHGGRGQLAHRIERKGSSHRRRGESTRESRLGVEGGWSGGLERAKDAGLRRWERAEALDLQRSRAVS